MTLDIAKGIQKGVAFLVKTYLALLGLCIALQILLCWLSSIHLSPGAKLEWALRDPDLGCLRDDPEFQRLVGKVASN